MDNGIEHNQIGWPPQILDRLELDCARYGQQEAVRMLQRALCSAGSIVQVTGELDDATVSAVCYVPEVILLPCMARERKT